MDNSSLRMSRGGAGTEDVPQGKPFGMASLAALVMFGIFKVFFILYVFVACVLPVYAMVNKWSLFVDDWQLEDAHYIDDLDITEQEKEGLKQLVALQGVQVLRNLFPERTLIYFSIYRANDVGSLFVVMPLCWLIFGTALCLVTLVAKWALVFRYTDGNHAYPSFFYMRWSLVDSLCGLVDAFVLHALRDTIFLNLWYNLMGAHIAWSARIRTLRLRAFDLIYIGEGSVVETEASVSGQTFDVGMLWLRKVVVGSYSHISPRASISPGTTVNSNERVLSLTTAFFDEDIELIMSEEEASAMMMPRLSRSAASPAASRRGNSESSEMPTPLPSLDGHNSLSLSSRRGSRISHRQSVNLGHSRQSVNLGQSRGITKTTPAPPKEESHAIGKASLASTVLLTFGHMFGLVCQLLSTATATVAAVLVIVGMNEACGFDQQYQMVTFIPLGYVAFGLVLWATGVVFKWLLLGVMSERTYSIDGAYQYRKWLADRMVALAYRYFIQLWAGTVLPNLYLLSLGARLPADVQVEYMELYSDAGLLSIGHTSFCSGFVLFHPDELDLKTRTCTQRPIDIGAYTFIGNHSVVFGGAHIEHLSLVADLALVPVNADVPSSSLLLGAPMAEVRDFRISQAQFELNPVRLYVYRFAQILGVLYFLWILTGIGMLVYRVFFEIDEALKDWDVLDDLHPDPFFGRYPLRNIVVFPIVLYGLFLVTYVFVAILHKWVLLRRMNSSKKEGMFSIYHYFWWWIRLPIAFAFVLFGYLRSTPYICWWYSLMGADISHTANIRTAIPITEPDLLQVGAGSVLGEEVHIQCHRFSDRVLDLRKVDIGQGCILGDYSVLDCDVVMGNNSSLEPLSVVMSAERVGEQTSWGGSPASMFWMKDEEEEMEEVLTS